jgi:DNA-binding response OmpR family regulator
LTTAAREVTTKSVGPSCASSIALRSAGSARATSEILELVRLRLTRFGYDTILAHDGRQAIGLAGAYQPHLALIDVSMPELDGYDVTRELKQDPKTNGIPVILLTALADGEAIARGFEAGADDYITKPFSPQGLESRVATMLARSGEQEAATPNRNGIRVVRSA